jgi:mono/diheme cytochrome c family protein
VLATTIIPTLALILLVAVPFLDRNPERSPRRRPLAMILGALAAFAVVSLTLAGDLAVRREERAVARKEAAGKAQAAPAAHPAERPPPNQAELAEAGEQLFDVLKCGSCHAVTGPPRDGIPTLAWEGDRARRSWLSIYLKKPTRIRWETDPKKQGRRPERRMPDFDLTDSEVEQLTAFLAAKRDPEMIPPQADLAAPAESAAVERGETLVHKTYRCIICHRIDSEGNPFGPDLAHVGSRRRPDFLYAIIHNPYRLDHHTAMKNLHLSPDEVGDAVRYLTTLR